MFITDRQYDGFDDVPLSEPFTTFKNNTIALYELVITSTSNLKEYEKIVYELKEGTKRVKITGNIAIDGLQKLANQVEAEIIQLHKQENIFNKSNRYDEYQNTIGDLNKLKSTILSDINSLGEQIQQGDLMLTEAQRLLSIRFSVWMPMAFIYLVTIWDAFVMDTARSILQIHPQLISESAERIQISKSDILKIQDTTSIRDYLIELEVRKLDADRKILIKTFRDYWGIDFDQSLVNMNEISEIRARRDIWVHNSGIVNEQYKSMVGDAIPLNTGQVAEITHEYFEESFIKMTVLAAFIHKEAHLKHYSKSL